MQTPRLHTQRLDRTPTPGKGRAMEKSGKVELPAPGTRSQRERLRRAAARAEWDVPDGRLGGLVHQHRYRAKIVAGRARRLMAALMATVLVGLIYYIVLPLVQDFLATVADRGYLAARTEAAEIETRIRRLEDRRNALWSNVVAAVEAFADDDVAEQLTDLIPPPGAAGDTAMRTAIAALPEEVSDADAVDGPVDTLEDLLGQRDIAFRQLAEAQRQQADIRVGGLASAETQQAFAEYMATCRAGASDAAITSACVTGFTDVQRVRQETLWETLADRAPPAILLLFLLSTLGGLYRYNARLAGFHQARADALEMLSLARGAADIEALKALSEALGADRVDFGKIAMPSEQALEMTRTLLSRAKA